MLGGVAALGLGLESSSLVSSWLTSQTAFGVGHFCVQDRVHLGPLFYSLACPDQTGFLR